MIYKVNSKINNEGKYFKMEIDLWNLKDTAVFT